MGEEMRKLNYTTATYGNLIKGNSKFSFAAKHALIDYKTEAIFSFIPKNGCSSLRLSLALRNGAVDSTEHHNWIHNNNEIFIASYKELIEAKYTAVVLRCPYQRLLSVYLDKIVGRTSLAWALENKLERRMYVEEMSFFNFVKAISKLPLMDHHWRPQSDFLIYEEYDDYFDLKDINKACNAFKKKLDFDLIDARGLYKHGSDQLKERYSAQEAFNIMPIELLHQKWQGRLPKNVDFFNDQIIEIVKNIYRADIELYQEHFSTDRLMFK